MTTETVTNKSAAVATSSKRVVMVTGFPGFLAKRLLRQLGTAQPGNEYVLLVEERFQAKAEDDLRELESEVAALEGRWQVVVGDITDPQLGLSYGDYWDLVTQVNRFWHFAAIYDLAVKETVAHKINVAGTQHVLDFCAECTDFRCLYYVSTCYVSGDRRGEIREDELAAGQKFKNHYESTKFLAEKAVQERWDKIPTVIFRPAVVVGDSKTGETDKYDGPYPMIQLLMRLPQWAPVPAIGRGDSTINLVPVDFVIDAMVAISGQEGITGKVYQLADPEPMSTHDGLQAIHHALGRSGTLGRLPPALAEASMSVGLVRRLVGMPKQVVVYMNHDARYDTSNVQAALEGTGISCPRFADYLATLIDYVKAHPEKQFLVRHEL